MKPISENNKTETDENCLVFTSGNREGGGQNNVRGLRGTNYSAQNK